MAKIPINKGYSSPGRGAGRAGSGGFNSGRNPPPSTGAPGAHRRGCGRSRNIVPLIMALPFLVILGMIREYRNRSN